MEYLFISFSKIKKLKILSSSFLNFSKKLSHKNLSSELKEKCDWLFSHKYTREFRFEKGEIERKIS